MTSPRTLFWQGAASLLSDANIEDEAVDLDVPVAALRAVLEIESAGRGFDDQARPKILFEPHVFWRNLVPEMREEANHLGLAWPHWQPGKYPRTSDAMYEMLERAIGGSVLCRLLCRPGPVPAVCAGRNHIFMRLLRVMRNRKSHHHV